MTNKTVGNEDSIVGGLVELKDSVAKGMDRQVTTLRAVMKEHPLAVLAVAVGAGYLLARLVHR